MGNIKSFCCKDSPSGDDDQEERARIINDRYASTSSLYNSSNSCQDAISYGSLNNNGGSKMIEQSTLDKIYQKMATNVIDVAPGESITIQPAEFIERQKAYQSRLNQLKTPLPLRLSNNRMVKSPLGGPSTDSSRLDSTTTSAVSEQTGKSQERVEYEPISHEDIQLINDVSERTAKAISRLKINSKERVITQFQP